MRKAAIAEHVESSHGCWVTDVCSTVAECALELGIGDSLPIIDCALRYGLVTKEDLDRCLERFAKGRHGRERARQAIRLADGRSENGGESRVRGLIYELGYMAPTDLQVEFADPVDGGATIRVDLFWRLPNGRGVIGEVDGLEKYKGDALGMLVRERQRESHITALGYPVMRVQFSRIDEPGYLESRLRAFGIPKRG